MDIRYVKQMLAEMAAMDLSNAPSLRFQAALKTKIQFRLAPELNWSAAEVEEFILSMQVELGMADISDADIDEMAESYFTLIQKMTQAMKAHGFTNIGAGMKTVASKLSLKLS